MTSSRKPMSSRVAMAPTGKGARVWSIHVTRNYVTGSESNAQAVLNWLVPKALRE